MKRSFWVVLFGVSLAAMLCIGFVMGAVFAPVMARTFHIGERFFNRNRVESNLAPRVEINPPHDKNYDSQRQTGVLIAEVVPGSPADQAGLQAGDAILSFDGRPVKTGEELARLLKKHKPGDQVKVEAAQVDQEKRSVTVNLGENPDQKDTAWLGVRYSAGDYQPSEGNLPQMPGKEQPGLPVPPRDEMPFPPILEHPGALIQEVLANSPAEQAGLKTGQLIQAVDGKPISPTNNLADVIASHKPGDIITLTVYTHADLNNPGEIKVKLGENPDKVGAAWLGIRFVFINLDQQNEHSPEG